MEDTISAISTAIGDGAVGIIRISGPKALEIGNSLFEGAVPLCPENARRLLLGHSCGDEVLAVFMPLPHSYTGEDVVEIQCHGGVEVLREILSASYRAGARPAEPGEFTKRAFLNGRMDLAQAEAVMQVIQAKSGASLRAAQRQREGALSRETGRLRNIIKEVIIQLEANIDYPEYDIEEKSRGSVAVALQEAAEGISTLLAGARTGRILREGLLTAIVGRPNVGKSSLLNALLNEERAIVSDIPGTTRDILREQVVIGGVPLILTDTAGIREGKDVIERIGIEKTEKAMQSAELILLVLDGSAQLTDEDLRIIAEVKNRPAVAILNKFDKKPWPEMPLGAFFSADRIFRLSALTGEGLSEFTGFLREYAYGSSGDASSGVLVQSARHEELLRQAAGALENARGALDDGLPYDCIIIDLREVMEKLGGITGENISDEIVNEIFARFCVGK